MMWYDSFISDKTALGIFMVLGMVWLGYVDRRGRERLDDKFIDEDYDGEKFMLHSIHQRLEVLILAVFFLVITLVMIAAMFLSKLT